MEMTHEERMNLCDMGYFNDTIRGYLIQAMDNAGFDEPAIRRALDGLEGALDQRTAEEAADIYRNF